ncbi:MAG: FHA domain-containing protein [Deltaproteobacteria bacterium]|nr:FHA domain-containing protein [Deltaproteobacteria bacterium]
MSTPPRSNPGSPRPASGPVPVGENKDKTVMMSATDAQRALAIRPSASADAFFLVCMGPNVGHKYPLFESTLLGRSEAADITLVDDRVSGRHCEVLREPGGYRIKDLGSSNGTLVNAQKISDSELRDGDLVQVGYTVFKYQTAAGASSSSGRVERVNQDPQVLMNGMQMNGMNGMNGGMPNMQMGMNGNGMPSVVVNAGPPPSAPDQEMNLEEMVGNVRKVVDFFLPFKKVIAIAAAVGLVGGVALAVASPPTAKASFEMNIINSAGSAGPGGTGVAGDRATAAKSNFKSTVLLKKTLETLGQADTSDDRIAVLQKNLNFESTTPNFGMPPPVQNFVGDFTANSEENALLFMQTHVKTFVESEVEKVTKVIQTKVDYLKEQITKVEVTRATSDQELKEFKTKYLASLPENAAKSQEFVFELQKTEGELSSAIEQLKLEIVGATTGGGGGRKAKLVQGVKDEIAELKAGGLGDNHPDVLALKTRLARVEAMAEDTGGSGRSGDKSVGQMKAEIQGKTLQLESTRKQLETVLAARASLPDFEARYSSLTRNYDSSKKLYEQLTEERNQTEYQLGFEKTAAEARFEIVVPPRVEKQSAGKAYGKKVVMGLVGGIAIGFALAAFMQILKIWKRSNQ